MVMKKFPIISFLLLLFISLCEVSAQKNSEILFLGSSSTYFHQMPKQVAQWVNGLGAYGKVSHHWVGEGGTWTWKYLNKGYRPKQGLPDDFSGNILDYIRQRNYRWISLQVALGQWDEWERTIPQYAQAAQAAGSQLLLYEQSWSPDTEKVLSGSPLLKMARTHNLTIVPCATAWEKVYAQFPLWDLQDSFYNVKKGYPVRDGTHPGLVGNYLNQACFVAAITQTHPDAMMSSHFYHHERMAHPKSEPYLPAGITLKGSPADGLAEFTVERKLARYLRQVAWDTYNEVMELKKSAK